MQVDRSRPALHLLARRCLHWCGGWLATVKAGIVRSPGRFGRLVVGILGLIAVTCAVLIRLAAPVGLVPASPVTAGLVQRLTQLDKLWFGAVIAVVALFGIRTVFLEVFAYFRNGPLEVQALRNATGEELNMSGLEAAFHQDLAQPRLYPITTVPGDRDPDRLIEILTPRGSGHEKNGWRDLVRSAYGYAVPIRAFVVDATLRRRAAAPHYGVAVRIRHLPLSFVELETVWSTDPERALQRAAYSVCAFVLPHTRACRSAPWTDWQSKRIPPQLFRGYHRAKRMIHERRYDEALQLYHDAVKIDSDNVVMRYEMGQLFERLRLYADALDVYCELMRELFPGGPSMRRTRWGIRRATFPRWWPSGTSGPFDIRYRYVNALSASDDLVRELCQPDWPELQRVLAGEKLPEEEQPLRAVESMDLRRRLGEALDPWADYVVEHWPESAGAAPREGEPRTFSELVKDGYHNEASRRVLAVYLLVCARAEAAALTRAFSRVVGHVRRRGTWSLTTVACRQVELLIEYKLDRSARRRDEPVVLSLPDDGGQSRPGREALHVSLGRVHMQLAQFTHPLGVLERVRRSGARAADLAPRGPWPVPDLELDVDQIARDLRALDYEPDSRFWLEHYVAACIYSVSLLEDQQPFEEHRAFAERAVEAIEAAERHGDEISFITAKEFWIVAGDPDLVGLRAYDCFRAFESRVYSHPLPKVRNLARYERYAFILTMLRQGAGALEERWRERARAEQAPEPSELEEHWRQELHAWQLAVRLGRFYRQWQTRQLVHEAFRNWSELTGNEMIPITYPNVARQWYAPYVSEFGELEGRLVDTEEMFKGLGELGRLEFPDGAAPADDGSLLQNTRAWLRYAQSHSRSVSEPWAESAFAASARAREQLWAALRHWAESPRNSAPFTSATRRLPRTPDSGRLRRRR